MAEAVVSAISENVAKPLVASNEFNELQLMRDGEQMCVEEARNNDQAINPLVGDWLSEVKEISKRAKGVFEWEVSKSKV
ncbi:hypothetical protein LguiB_004138 [Lonicera macranthoides]